MVLKEYTFLFAPMILGLVFCQPADLPAVLKELPDEVLFQVGKPFELNCEIESGDDSNVKFEWIAEFKDMKSNPKIIQNDQKLVFKEMKDSDEGLYQCIAKTSAGVASTRHVKLMKTYISVPKVPVQKITPVEGRPFQLACPSVEGYPKPQVEWRKKNLANGQLETFRNPRIFSPNGDLYFSNATEEDVSKEFHYVCLVSSPAVDSAVPVVEWIVEGLTKDDKPVDNEVVQQFVSGDSTAKVGDVTEIYCVYGGNPMPHPDWWKDDVNVNNEPGDRVTRYNHSRGKRLLIKQTLVEDEGRYTCVIDNGAGKVQKHSIHLTVVTPPRFLKTPDKRINIKEGQELILPCEFEVKPAGEVAWTHNTKVIRDGPTNPTASHNTFKYENNLKIDKVQKSDSGYYGCRVTNSFGEAYTETLVVVS